MNIFERHNLPNDFDESLIEKSIPLNKIGINELGWKYEDVFNVLDFLCSRGYAILGGDVYSIKENSFESTFANWYLNRDKMQWDTFINVSKEKAVDYITAYNTRNKDKQDKLLYVLVYQQEK